MSAIRDLLIIGGGAAGIGAGLEAKRRGLDALIVEAKDRLGGRAHSVAWNGYHIDLGCTWLHSAERNSLRAEAERIGASVDRSATGWFGQYRNLGFSPDDQRQAGEAFEALEQRMQRDPPETDRASEVLDPASPWNAWIEALSGYINGAQMRDVSVADWLAYDNAASDQNWRLPGGYGSLVVALAQEMDVRLGTPVSAVSRFRGAVRVETSEGTIEARRVIVAIPTSALPNVRFDPPIGVVEAALNLPLGLADKIFFALDDPEEFPHGAHLLGNPRSAETGSYFLRPLGMPVVEGFFGGDGARAIEALGPKGAADFAAGELVALLGSDIGKRLHFITMSRWASEPWIMGSYSHALPGRALCRALLAAAGDDRIAFAGEAVSTGDYSTTHGAFDSGRAAVARLFPVAD